jgi:hypothetical protein
VCHLWGWFDTVFRLSQEVVIFWLVANQCKFYRGTQARIGNIWGKYDYGYSRMSLYINGNVLTARFLVTGNYCILFDSGQLLKHDQGVPCRSMTKHDQTNSHQTFCQLGEQKVPCRSMTKGYLGHLFDLATSGIWELLVAEQV